MCIRDRKNTIKGLIESGEIQKGEKIPSEHELCKKYDVSRITAVSYTHLDVYKRQVSYLSVFGKVIVFLYHKNPLKKFTEKQQSRRKMAALR